MVGDERPFSFTGSFVTTTTGANAPVVLSARVTEQADGRFGSTLNSGTVAFSVVGGAVLCTAPVSVSGGGTGTASCTVPSLPIGSYAIIATPSAVSYEGPVGLGAVAVAKSASGNAVGAGTVNGDTFAFEAAKAVKKTPIRGSAVHVWSDGSGFGYVAAGGTVSSFVTSCSGGGSNRACTIPVGAGTAAVTKVDLTTGASTAMGAGSIAGHGRSADRAHPVISGCRGRS